LEGITIGWETEALGLELRLILKVGTYVDVPVAPVSQLKFEAWEKSNPHICVMKTKTEKNLNKCRPKS